MTSKSLIFIALILFLQYLKSCIYLVVYYLNLLLCKLEILFRKHSHLQLFYYLSFQTLTWNYCPSCLVLLLRKFINHFNREFGFHHYRNDLLSVYVFINQLRFNLFRLDIIKHLVDSLLFSFHVLLFSGFMFWNS